MEQILNGHKLSCQNVLVMDSPGFHSQQISCNKKRPQLLHLTFIYLYRIRSCPGILFLYLFTDRLLIGQYIANDPSPVTFFNASR